MQGRIAVVTGAGRRAGIGAAICRALAALGADVFLTHWPAYDRAMPWGEDREGVEFLQRELSGMGVRCATLALDLAEPGSAARVLDAVDAQLGPPQILVNNATHSTREDFRQLDATSLDAHYAVNLRATALLSVEFARRFGGNGRANGRIINLVSGESLGPMPEELAYAATKGAIEAFTRSLAAGVASLGITVNAVNPGPTDSGWLTPAQAAEVLRRSPFGRLGQPEDAARLIAFLASDEGAWITGQVLHSEGGFMRG